MKHLQHLIEVGEHDDDVFWKVPLNLKVVPRYAVVVHDQTPDVHQ
jgi:hypothetical protein